MLLENFEDLKSSLINCPPEALQQKLQKAQNKYQSKLATKALAVFGLKATKPTVVQAMSDLHLTHDYEVAVPKPKDAWEAAQSFIKNRDSMKNPYPGTPVVCKPPSRSSSTASASSQGDLKSPKGPKEVRWAEVLEEVRIFE